MERGSRFSDDGVAAGGAEGDGFVEGDWLVVVARMNEDNVAGPGCVHAGRYGLKRPSGAIRCARAGSGPRGASVVAIDKPCEAAREIVQGPVRRVGDLVQLIGSVD